MSFSIDQILSSRTVCFFVSIVVKLIIMIQPPGQNDVINKPSCGNDNTLDASQLTPVVYAVTISDAHIIAINICMNCSYATNQSHIISTHNIY